MNLSQKIVAALDLHTDACPPPCHRVIEEGHHRLALDLTANEKVGLAFDALYFTTNCSDWSTESLRAFGNRLAAQLTYLMEPLVVLEVDPTGGELEIRSRTPTSRCGQRCYYEIRLKQGGELRLTRVAFDEVTRHRRAIPCHFTREVLERLADDLVACAP
jgi:hypothetical protein